EIYSRFSQSSLAQWKELSKRSTTPLFHKSGVLWLGKAKDPRVAATASVLSKLKIPVETLNRADLEKRFSQFSFGDYALGVYEPESGALMARRCVQTLVHEMIGAGLEVLLEPVTPISAKSRVASIATVGGKKLTAGAYVFACGPWLAKVFPNELGQRIFPTR